MKVELNLEINWHLQILGRVLLYSQRFLCTRPKTRQILRNTFGHCSAQPLEGLCTTTFRNDWGLRGFTAISTKGLPVKHPIEDLLIQHDKLFCLFLDMACFSPFSSSDHLQLMQLLSAKLKYQSRHNSFLFCDKFEMQSSGHAHITSVGFDHSFIFTFTAIYCNCHKSSLKSVRF